MKASVVIHPRLLEMLASLGHTDRILICDAGFPVPPQLPTVDLAYRPGHAPFLDVLSAVVATVHVEHSVVASEIAPDLAAAIDGVVGLDAERIPHASLKEQAGLCRGVVRTGEYTPFANVILSAGVPF